MQEARRRWFVAGVVWAAIAAPGYVAAGQDAAFLTPAERPVKPGAAVAVRVARGGAAGPAVVAWPGGRADWMFISAAGDQENRHEVQADEPGGDSVGVTAPESGVAVIGLDLGAEVLRIDQAAFDAFRAVHVAPGQGTAGLGRVGPAPGVVRVRRYESLNSVIRVDEPGREPSPSQIVTAKTGQRASIRPVMDPTGLRAGGDLPFRVYTNGRSVAGGRLTATHVATGRTQTVDADSAGIGGVHIESTGLWRLEFHHAVPSADGGAEWDLYSATLTFEVTRPAKEAE